MKIRYRNFTRDASRYPWAADVPEKLVRKPKILSAWEFIQFIIALFFGGIIVFNSETWQEWVFLIIPVGFFISAFLLASDNHLYRRFSLLSVALSITWLAYQGVTTKALLFSVSAGLPLFVFCGAMYVGTKSTAYYAWCESKYAAT